MAYALRIDNISVIAGQVDVYYTAGLLPLSPIPSGNVRTFANKTQLTNAVKAVASNASIDTVALLLLARALKRDATISKGFAAFVAGEQICIDLDSDNLITVTKTMEPKIGLTKIQTIGEIPSVPVGTVCNLIGSNYIAESPISAWFSISYVNEHPELFGPA